MKGARAEALRFAACLALALVLHALALPRIGGEAAGAFGQEGQNSVSLAASEGALAQRVARWQTPPVVAEALALPAEIPDPPERLPEPPSALSLPVLPPLAGLALLPDGNEEPIPESLLPAPPPPPPPAAPAPPRPAQPSAVAAQPALRASGSGDGPQAGTGARAAAPGGAGEDRSALAAWGAQIRARIERALPRSGRGGTVVLGLRVAANGALQAVSVLESSGDGALDSTALQSVRNAAPFAAAPGTLGASGRSFRITLRFRR